MDVGKEEVKKLSYIAIPRLNLGGKKPEEFGLGKMMIRKLSMNEDFLPSVSDYNLCSRKEIYIDLMSIWKSSAAPSSSH